MENCRNLAGGESHSYTADEHRMNLHHTSDQTRLCPLSGGRSRSSFLLSNVDNAIVLLLFPDGVRRKLQL